MPYKDRATRLAYLAAYRAKHRPSPAPEPQEVPGFPPRGRMIYSDDGAEVQCHACGQWYRSLTKHLPEHGLDAASYKAEYGLARGASLWSPITQQKQREAALARGQGDIGRVFLTPHGPRPRGITARLQSRVEESQQRRGWNMRGREPKPDSE